MFSPDTAAAIAGLFSSPGDSIDRKAAEAIVLECATQAAASARQAIESAVQELGVEGSTLAGGAAGGAAGAAIGAALGDALGALFDAGGETRESLTNVGAGIGGLLGAAGGAITGNLIARSFTAKDFLREGESKADVLRSCERTLGITTTPASASSPQEIRAAYKAKARSAHPDRGGSQEAMVRLNFCKEALLAAAGKGG
jgi:hypothetical protein